RRVGEVRTVGAADRRDVPRALVVAGRTILLAATLFEVQRLSLVSPTAVAFNAIAEATGWSDVFHLVFAVAVFVRAVFAAAAVAIERPSDEDEAAARRRLRSLLTFSLLASFWMALLPVFGDGGPFFVEWIAEKKGKVVERTLNVTPPRYSMLDLLVKAWYGKAILAIKAKVKGQAVREIRRGLLRPLAFHGKVKRVLLILRWAKYLGPLVGTCNKLRGHIIDMARKRRQRRASCAARRRWNLLLDALCERTRLERAALKMQRRFREGREAKACRRLALLATRQHRAGGGSDDADHAGHRRIREKLAEERRARRTELNRMDRLDSCRANRRKVSGEDRGAVVRHRQRERGRRKRLLLSPKTSFAVRWKLAVVACAGLEIAQIAFAPALEGQMSKMPLDRFLLWILVCGSAHPVSYGGRAWLAVARIIAAVAATMANAVFFLDVFVTFFTGEMNQSCRGNLDPKPPFARYILPGVGLQLIVNPTMRFVSKLVKRAIVHALRVGPSLSLHLSLACIPFAACWYNCLLDLVFDFIERQNRCKMAMYPSIGDSSYQNEAKGFQ
ncbi:hypothetical protein ACHAWF_011170, partial [Thalassiosira exigua]